MHTGRGQEATFAQVSGSRRSSIGALGLLLVVGVGIVQQETAEPAELAPRHRQWLEEDVVYIIAPLERQAFLMLDSDEARDAFVEAFWRPRDPTPGTARNEAREDHQRRLAYANRYLGYETPREGWRTDRGRIYIQLGEPEDQRSYPDPTAFWPIELWFYRTNPTASGLPPFFYMMFFRPQMSGEYKLYDPVTDGPAMLVNEFMLQMADPAQIVQRLLQSLGHEVAMASVNLVPTERTSFIDPMPTPGNALLFAAIEEAPLKGVDVEYARAFVANWGEVEARVAYTTMPVDLAALVLWDERGLPYLHYAVEIPPEKVLLGEYESDYYFSLSLDLSINDLRGQVVVFDNDSLEQHFNEERAQAIIRAPLAYYDRVDLVPGVYDLSISLRNLVTNESGLAEARLSVPGTPEEGSVLSDLLVAFDAHSLGEVARGGGPRAFRFDGRQFLPSTSGKLPLGGTAELFAQLVAGPEIAPGESAEIVASLLDADGVELNVVDATVGLEPHPAPTPLRAAVPLSGLSPGSYRLRLSARLSGGQGYTRERQVEVVRANQLQRPQVLMASEASAEGIEEYRLRGWQHLRKGELAAAAAYFRAGLEQDPGAHLFRRALAQLLVDDGEFAEAVRVLRPLVVSPAASPADLLLMSEALRRAGAAADAAAVARRVLQVWRPTASAYNALAEALLELGEEAEAIEMLRASLGLNPDQPEVREKLARLTGESS